MHAPGTARLGRERVASAAEFGWRRRGGASPRGDSGPAASEVWGSGVSQHHHSVPAPSGALPLTEMAPCVGRAQDCGEGQVSPPTFHPGGAEPRGCLSTVPGRRGRRCSPNDGQSHEERWSPAGDRTAIPGRGRGAVVVELYRVFSPCVRPGRSEWGRWRLCIAFRTPSGAIPQRVAARHSSAGALSKSPVLRDPVVPPNHRPSPAGPLRREGCPPAPAAAPPKAPAPAPVSAPAGPIRKPPGPRRGRPSPRGSA